MKILDVLREFYEKDLKEAQKLEEAFLQLYELKIDTQNTYTYNRCTELEIPGNYSAWTFTDRCGNDMACVYLHSTGEYKSGYRLKDTNRLVFEPNLKVDPKMSIRPCPDDSKLSTIYKILVDEVVPKYLLNKKPNRLQFNPISKSRERIVRLLLQKVVQQYPDLEIKNNYLIYK